MKRTSFGVPRLLLIILPLICLITCGVLLTLTTSQVLGYGPKQSHTQVRGVDLLSQPRRYHKQRVNLIDRLTMVPYTGVSQCQSATVSDLSILTLPTYPPNIECASTGEVMLPFVMCTQASQCPQDAGCVVVPIANAQYIDITGTFRARTDEFDCPRWHLRQIDVTTLRVSASLSGPWYTIPASDISEHHWLWPY